jgi:hypothetical protein
MKSLAATKSIILTTILNKDMHVQASVLYFEFESKRPLEMMLGLVRKQHHYIEALVKIMRLYRTIWRRMVLIYSPLPRICAIAWSNQWISVYSFSC